MRIGFEIKCNNCGAVCNIVQKKEIVRPDCILNRIGYDSQVRIEELGGNDSEGIAVECSRCGNRVTNGSY